MFEKEKVNLGRGDSYRPSMNWQGMPLSFLLATMDEIRKFLPPTSLADMNLEEELILQFHATRELQTQVIDDASCPANQKAQVANAVAATLQKLVDLQETVYTQERWKKIEQLMVKTLSLLPEDTAEKFLVEYENLLRRMEK